MSQGRPFIWKRHWKQLGWACKLGGAEPQWITKVRQHSVSQVDGISGMSPNCQVCWGRAKKRNNGPRQPRFCLGESVPPALTLMPDTSVPPHTPLLPSNLCSRARAQRKWIWVSLWVGPLRGAAWDSSTFSSTTSIPFGFYNQESWGFIFLVLDPWAGGTGVRLGPITHEISFLTFINHTWVWDQPVPCLPLPSYQSHCGFFFNFIAVELLYPFS